MTDTTNQDSAIKARDTIEKIVRKVVNQERPLDRHAVVQSFTPETGTAVVVYVGEENATNNTHTVKVGAIQPSAVGQRVIVTGPSGDRWIRDVLGQALVNGSAGSAAVGSVGTITYIRLRSFGEHIQATINPMDGATEYEFQVDDNNSFTSPSTYRTQNTQFQVPDFLGFGTFWVRARAVANGTPGEWSVGFSVEITPYSEDFLDGYAPSESPAVTCTGGIGWVHAEWPAVSNNDLVTYDVFVSLESGAYPSYGPNGTYYGQTTSTFYSINDLPNGDPLPYDTNVFVRVWAKDGDGYAYGGAGAQGFAMPRRVELGDVGNVTFSATTDGSAPQASPYPTVRPGVGIVFLKWDHVNNTDQVTYEVHVSTVYGFTPTANTLALETYSNFAFVKNAGAGLGYQNLSYETVYYGVIWTKDADGYAPGPGPQFSFTVLKAGAGTIGTGAIDDISIFGNVAIGSALIDEAAVREIHIGEGAVTNLKVGQAAIGNLQLGTGAVESINIKDAQINTSHIGDLEVTTGWIGDLQVTAGKMAYATITDAQIGSLDASKIKAGWLSGSFILGGEITGTTIRGVEIYGGSYTTDVPNNPWVGEAPGGFLRIGGASSGFIGFVTDSAVNPNGFSSIGQIKFASNATSVGNGQWAWHGNGLSLEVPNWSHGVSSTGPMLGLWDHEYGRFADFKYMNFTRFPGGTVQQPGIQLGQYNLSQGSTYSPPEPTQYPIGFHASTSGELYAVVNGQWVTRWAGGAFNNTSIRFGSGLESSLNCEWDPVQFQTDVVFYRNGQPIWSAAPQVSDQRIKKNVVPLDDLPGNRDRTALDIINAVPMVEYEFNRKKVKGLPAGRRLGLTAQDLETVFPQGIKRIKHTKINREYETLLLDIPSMVMLLWRAIEELDRGNGQPGPP